MAGLLQFSQWQATALVNLEAALAHCKKEGLVFAGFTDRERDGQIDLRAFRAGASKTDPRLGYWVDSEIENQCY